LLDDGVDVRGAVGDGRGCVAGAEEVLPDLQFRHINHFSFAGALLKSGQESGPDSGWFVLRYFLGSFAQIIFLENGGLRS
jgi:hypothetical protein